MNLTEHLALRTPLLWVTTEEPGRVIDSIIANVENRQIFRNDALEGFVVWSQDKSRWLKVLVDFGGGALQPTGDLNMVIAHLIDTRGVLIMENAHKIVEPLLGFFTAVQLRYRDAFKADDISMMPPQLVLLSSEAKLPDELARVATRVETELPDAEELERITRHIAAKHQMDEVDVPKVVRAAVGMSETEFINTSLLSIRKSNIIDPSYIADLKIERLKKNNILDVRQPKLTVDQLGGMDLGKQLVEDVEWTWNHPEEAAEFGVEPLRRVLLVGVPGTGKSLLCEATSSLLGLDLAKGGVSNAMGSFVGESEQNMRNMFAALKAMAPIVFWIDEFGRDMSGGASSAKVDGGTTDRVHGEFLTGLQELPNNVFLMAAANNIETLAPEMTRADRFDKIMFVGFPTQEERMEIFRIHLGERHVEMDVEALADRTAYFTGAEIKALIKETRSKVGTRERRHITTKDLLTRIPLVKTRVWLNFRPQILAMYNRAMNEWDWASSGQQDEAEALLKAANSVRTAPTPTTTAKYEPKGFSATKTW